MIPLNILGHERGTSHKHRCMCFTVLLLGRLQRVQRLGWLGRPRRQKECWYGRSPRVSGRAMVSPGRHQTGRCKRTPCGSSWWWRMRSCRARSQSWCQLERPADRSRLTGGQLRPTDRAMAARSARTSSSEGDARSTDEEDRLLTKRCVERQCKNICLRVTRLPCDHESDGQS